MSAGKEVAIEVSVPALGMGTGAELELRGEGGEIGLAGIDGRAGRNKRIGRRREEREEARTSRNYERKRGGGEKKSIGGAEKEVKKGRLEVKRLEVKGVDAIKSDYICSNNSYTYRCIKQ